ncbi:hypothetical protein DFH08DRAFT_988836 [Mycena albidolilacea]|uniref:Uncharacterized protein n=1 Tax=Mycena albidolilacea TaxID=1033008 RepID=A0AAD7E8Y3_9AGAR|nr:hypothetical protein DFH08DRAFT_988836 [Mycena albidolilacea]
MQPLPRYHALPVLRPRRPPVSVLCPLRRLVLSRLAPFLAPRHRTALPSRNHTAAALIRRRARVVARSLPCCTSRASSVAAKPPLRGSHRAWCVQSPFANFARHLARRVFAAHSVIYVHAHPARVPTSHLHLVPATSRPIHAIFIRAVFIRHARIHSSSPSPRRAAAPSSTPSVSLPDIPSTSPHPT